LHARWDFFGEKFEKQIWHGCFAWVGADAAASKIRGATQAKFLKSHRREAMVAFSAAPWTPAAANAASR
jgi:hypothetical protein